MAMRLTDSTREAWKPQECIGCFEKLVWTCLASAAQDPLVVVDWGGAGSACDPSALASAILEGSQKASAQGCPLVVDADSCSLVNRGTIQIAGSLQTASEVLLGENDIGSEGAAAIVSVLTGGACTRLDLAFNMLGNEGVATLCEGLREPSGLLHLSLRDNEIYTPGAEALAGTIAQGAPNLCSLNLRQNFLQNDGVRAICEALQGHPTLRALDLRENSLLAAAMEPIARFIEGTTSLETLALCRNVVEDEGAKQISAALKKNQTLLHLWLNDTRIGDAGGKSIGQALAKNKYILSLELRANPISQISARYIRSQCEQNGKRAQRIAEGLPSSDDDW